MEPEANGQPSENPALFVEFDPRTEAFGWGIRGQIPAQLLVNQLELIKANLINQQLMAMAQAQQQQAAKGIVMPDGSRPHLQRGR